jgi:hypothetical protein
MAAPWLRRSLKILHEVGAIGATGAFASCIVLLVKAPRSPVAYAAIREGIAAIAQYLLLPSLGIVLISGLLAIAADNYYKNAAWAWIKALLGITVFEGTLLTINAGARRAAELSALAANGHGDPAALAQVLHSEWGGLWLMMVLSLANVVLAVWRPRIYRSSQEGRDE